MSYNLFLDDARLPDEVTWVRLPDVDWVIVRTYDEFVQTIENRGVPDICSFDHDLADEHYAEYVNSTVNGNFNYNTISEKTGYHACKWLVNYLNDRNLPLPKCYIHTMNPIGEQNILSLIHSYRRNFLKTQNNI
jgi:hypothetical protein